MRGYFITFEGSEGSGKSTQIEMLCDYLKSKGKSVTFLREPGGVKISEKIREILLDVQNKEMALECEILLYMASRAQLVKEVLIPCLDQGNIVLCDRFLDSTIVYQGYGLDGDIDFIRKVGVFATQNIKPDLTFVFDIDAREGLSRIKRAKDRIEQRSIEYHNKVRQGYIALAQSEPDRIKLIPAQKSIEEIQELVLNYIHGICRI